MTPKLPSIQRPTPINVQAAIRYFDRSSEIKPTIAALEAGTQVLISAYYSDGLLLLSKLKEYLKKRYSNTSFREQRAFRAAYQKLSNLILVEVEAHMLVVKKAPTIGWFKKLYPEIPNFYLPFPQVQGLNSSWQWYQKGISVPVLRNKVHPYYGTYFPTRFDHLELFDNWLKRYEGPKKTAIDIGVGSGILSLQLIQHGFQKVFGTDTNPNAIVGLTEYMGTTKLSRKLDVAYASLFGTYEKQTELIICNPPWIPESQNLDTLDEAIYYPKDFFPEFFSAASDHLLPDGKVVLLFSNLAKITNVATAHPIEDELAKGGRFQLERCFKKRVKSASKHTKRDQYWRSAEEVELWVLIKK